MVHVFSAIDVLHSCNERPLATDTMKCKITPTCETETNRASTTNEIFKKKSREERRNSHPGNYFYVLRKLKTAAVKLI